MSVSQISREGPAYSRTQSSAASNQGYFADVDILRSPSDPSSPSICNHHSGRRCWHPETPVVKPSYNQENQTDESWLHGAWGSDLDPDEIFDGEFDDCEDDQAEPERDPDYLPRLDSGDHDLTPSLSLIATPTFNGQFSCPIPIPFPSSTSHTPIADHLSLSDVDYHYDLLHYPVEKENLRRNAEDMTGRSLYSEASSFAPSSIATVASWADSLPSSFASGISHMRLNSNNATVPCSPSQPFRGVSCVRRHSRAQSLDSTLGDEGEEPSVDVCELCPGLVKFALDIFSRPSLKSEELALNGFESISPLTPVPFLHTPSTPSDYDSCLKLESTIRDRKGALTPA